MGKKELEKRRSEYDRHRAIFDPNNGLVAKLGSEARQCLWLLRTESEAFFSAAGFKSSPCAGRGSPVEGWCQADAKDGAETGREKYV